MITRPGENVSSIQLADRSDQGEMLQESFLDTDEVEENSDSKVIVDRAMDITSQQQTLGDESRDDDTGENREDEFPMKQKNTDRDVQDVKLLENTPIRIENYFKKTAISLSIKTLGKNCNLLFEHIMHSFPFKILVNSRSYVLQRVVTRKH